MGVQTTAVVEIALIFQSLLEQSPHQTLKIYILVLMDFSQLKSAAAVFQKDLTLELKSKYGLNTILAFVSSALLVVLFSLRAERLSNESQAGLIWIIILFAAMSSLARAFVMEADKQTDALLRLHTLPSAVYIGKLLYNFAFILLVNVFSFGAYIFLLGLTIHNVGALIVSIVLGSAGLSGISTLLSAIVAEADRKGAVFSVLCIPLLVPLILLVSNITEAAITARNLLSMNDLAALIGYSGVTITAGLILFDFIWEDE